MAPATTRTAWSTWWPFLLLMLMGASRWMHSSARPEAESSAGSQAIGCAWAALVCMAWTLRPWVSKAAVKADRRSLWIAGLGGGLLFCGPAAGELLRTTRADASAWMMALSLTPVVVALAGRVDSVAGRIWPGLAAVAGLMLVLSQPSLGDVRSDVALALAPVLTGCGAALLCSERAQGQWRDPAALVGATSICVMIWLASAWPAGLAWPSLTATACDGMLALLSLLVLARIGAERWSAQFALLPLFILLEGMLILRPPLMLRPVIGLLLLAVAGIYLLLPQTEEQESGMGLRL